MVNKTPEELEIWRETEKAFLGAVMLNNDCLESITDLTSKHFQSRKHRRIFEAIENLRKGEGVADAAAVAQYLSDKGQLTDVGGAAYFETLMSACHNLESAPQHAQSILKEYSKTESLLKLDVAREAIQCGETEAALKALADIQCLAEKATSQRFEWISAAELNAAEYELDYFIENLYVKNQPLVIGGAQKTCKTNIASDLAISLASGRPFLNRFKVNGQYRVAFISCESGAAVLQDNNRRVAISKGILPGSIENLYYCFDIPSLDSTSDLAQIRAFIEKNKIDVLIIDPFYLTANLGNDAGNLFIVGEKLKPLTELGQATGCSVVLIHHTRKNTGRKEFAEPRMEDLAYSGLPQWMRQWFLIDRRSQFDGDQPGSHEFWFNGGGSAGHSFLFGLNIEEGSQSDPGGRKWEVDIIPAQEARAQSKTAQEQQQDIKKEARLQTDVEKVTEFLRASGPNTKTKIRTGTGMTPGRIEQALFSMITDGIIEECKVTASNHQEYDGYQFSSSFGNSLVKTTDTMDTITHTQNPLKGDCMSVCECEGDCVSESSTSTDLFGDVFPTDSNGDYFTEGF